MLTRVFGLCVQWRWARAHAEVDITGEGGALATSQGSDWLAAVCGEVLQAEGEAYAEFTWLSRGYLMVRVARAGVDPSSVPTCILYCTADGWMYYCNNGNHHHRGSDTPWAM